MTSALTEPRWTHVAIPASDIDRSVEFYTSLTPLVVVDTWRDDTGTSIWLSNEKQVETPMVLVLVQLADQLMGDFDQVPGRPHPTLSPFAHIGIELPSREAVDEIAERARAMGCLHWEPRQMPKHIGYICACKDPDGNVVEFSYDQKVYESVRRLWGSRE